METLGPDSKGLERQMERERSNMEKGGGVGVQESEKYVIFV